MPSPITTHYATLRADMLPAGYFDCLRRYDAAATERVIISADFSLTFDAAFAAFHYADCSIFSLIRHLFTIIFHFRHAVISSLLLFAMPC